MSLFSRIFGSDKSQNTHSQKENASKVESAAALQDKVQDTTDDGELVAVIMAALMNMLSANAVSDLRIKSIRRVGRNSPVWNIAGREEYISAKL